jgi:hypothetical protein
MISKYTSFFLIVIPTGDRGNVLFKGHSYVKGIYYFTTWLDKSALKRRK